MKKLDRFRDNSAWWLANLILRTVATKDYRKNIQSCMLIGLQVLELDRQAPKIE